ESKHPIRYTVREGDVLPLGVGSGGRVLPASSGGAGEPYATIPNKFHFVALGDRDPETACISSPVFCPGCGLRGALTRAGPRSRANAECLHAMVTPVLQAAARATRGFGEDATPLERAAASIPVE